MNKKQLLLSTSLTGSLALATGAVAAPEPAAPFNPGPYWEWAFGPSFSDGHPRGFLWGGLTYQQPYAGNTNWGFHLEANLDYGQNAYDNTDHSLTAQGVLFLRDPMMGEIGIVAGVTNFSDVYLETVTLIAVEGEYYLPRMTFSGSFGLLNGSQSQWVAQGGVAFYPTDDFKIWLKGVYGENNLTGASVGVEYQFGPELFNIPGVQTTAFANANFSEQKTSLLGGLRFAFGGSGGSLIYTDRNNRKNFLGLTNDLQIAPSYVVHK